MMTHPFMAIATLATMHAGSFNGVPVLASEPPTHMAARAPADDTITRHRRGDPSKALAAHPQAVVALPLQITERDIAYWCWVLGGVAFDEAQASAAFIAYQQQNDALRAARLPALFEAAITVAAPPDEWGAEQLRKAGRSLATLRNKFCEEEATLDRALFAALAELSQGAVDPTELDALRGTDFAGLYPDTLSAAKVDVGRMVYSLARTGKISRESALVAAAVLRNTLLDSAGARALALHTTSDLIADECVGSLLQTLAQQQGAIPRTEVDSAVAQRAAARRKFAALAGRTAERNSAMIDDIAAGVGEPDGSMIRRQFNALAYGVLAEPALDARGLATRVATVPDAAARAMIEAFTSDWAAAHTLRQRDVLRAFDTYERRVQANQRRDEELWRRTADRIAELHAESERTLLPILSLVVAAMGAEPGKAAQAEFDAMLARGRSHLADQIDAIDPSFSRTPAMPPPEGARVGTPVDMTKWQQKNQGTAPPAPAAP